MPSTGVMGQGRTPGTHSDCTKQGGVAAGGWQLPSLQGWWIFAVSSWLAQAGLHSCRQWLCLGSASPGHPLSPGHAGTTSALPAAPGLAGLVLALLHLLIADVNRRRGDELNSAVLEKSLLCFGEQTLKSLRKIWILSQGTIPT